MALLASYTKGLRVSKFRGTLHLDVTMSVNLDHSSLLYLHCCLLAFTASSDTKIYRSLLHCKKWGVPLQPTGGVIYTPTPQKVLVYIHRCLDTPKGVL